MKMINYNQILLITKNRKRHINRLNRIYIITQSKVILQK